MTAADIHLAEYDALKKEQIERIKFRDNLVYLTIGAVVAAVAGAVQTNQVGLLLAIPFVTAALGWKYVANDTKITEIGTYLREGLAPRLTEAAGEAVLGWEISHRTGQRRANRLRLQLGADLLTFALPGLAAAITWVFLHDRPSPALAVVAAIGTVLAVLVAVQLVRHAEPGSGRPVAN